eukprot:GHVS01074297.1.p1 GENE.GHVS01074297.1~~GHVS01074297.1.p1  ORF type:complete len:126 (+),score=12.84 GHVS01074297.1:172-549(+)
MFVRVLPRMAALSDRRGASRLRALGQCRYRSTIKFVDEKGTAEENIYFRQEEEVLLQNLLSSHPEYNPKYSVSTLEESFGEMARDMRLVCQKHGIKDVSLAFLKDIRHVFQSHGWKHPDAADEKV